jgi:hypothetical protein
MSEIFFYFAILFIKIEDANVDKKSIEIIRENLEQCEPGGFIFTSTVLPSRIRKEPHNLILFFLSNFHY